MSDLSDEEFLATYRKVDAETDMGENSNVVDEKVAFLIRSTADEVCSRITALYRTDAEHMLVKES